MRYLPLLLACTGSLVLFFSWQFHASVHDSLTTLQMQIHEKNQILKICRGAQRCFETNPTLKESLAQHHVGEPVSQSTFKSLVKEMGERVRLTRLELAFQPIESPLPVEFPLPLTPHRIHLSLEASSDQAVFQFMDESSDAIPGLIAYELVSVERINGAGKPFVKAEMTLRWTHTPQEEIE